MKHGENWMHRNRRRYTAERFFMQKDSAYLGSIVRTVSTKRWCLNTTEALPGRRVEN